MLLKIRDAVSGWVSYAIIAVLVVPFALWGIGDYLGVFGDTYAVKVNDTEIPLTQYRNAYTRRYVSVRDELGAEFRPEAIDENALRQQVLDEMVDEELLYQYAIASGLRISDAAVVEQIHRIQAFQEGGRFSSERYRYMLQLNGLTPAGFENDIRRTMVLTQLEQAIAGTSFMTRNAFRDLIRIGDQRREFAWIEIAFDQYADQVEVTDEQVAAYYAANQQRFMTVETVDIEYVELTADTVAAVIQVDEAALRERYEERLAAASAQEQRRASHILVESEALANELAAQLADGADFAALAAEHSADPGSASAGGDLGWVDRGSFVREFETALYAMEPDTISAPVRTGFGWHIIRLDEIRGTVEVAPFEELRGALATEYREAEAERRFYTMAERLADLAFENAGSLDPAAAALDLPVRRINGVSRAAGSGLADYAEVRNAAFSPEVLGERFNSRLLELSGEHVAVVRVADHTPSRQMAQEEVESAIRAELLRTQARALASATAESLVERARAGEELAALATEVGAVYHEPHVAGRADDHAPPTLLRALFRTPRPEADGAPVVRTVVTGDAVAVYRLLGVTAGTPELMEEDQVAGITAALASRQGQAEFHALRSRLRSQADIAYGSNLWSDEAF